MAKKNKTKRILVVYHDPISISLGVSQLGQRYAEQIESASRMGGKKLVAVADDREIVYPLPRDYDAYFLHLRNVNKDDLVLLREQRPTAWICGFCEMKAGRKFVSSTMKTYGLDELHDLLPDNLDDILEQIASGKRR